MSGYEQFFYTASDGLKLACRQYGWDANDAPVAVCLPGLTRNAADFHELALHLSQRAQNPRRVLVFDYRGRGRSDYDSNWENYTVLTEADDVTQGMIANHVHEADFIGTSRGGLVIMVLSAMKPAIIGKVVFNDIGPEIEGTGLVRIKNMIEGASMTLASWTEAREALKLIGEHDFPNRDDAEWERQARLIYREEDGKLIRDHDPKLANLMRAINLDQPIPSLWPQFEGLKQKPLLVLRGARSDLLTQDTAEKMRDLHGSMELVTVEDQGHAPDLGTAGLPETIERFLNGRAVS